MSDTLPPGPWRIEPIPHRKDLRVVAPNGSLLAEVTGPDKAAVAALLVRAREVEGAARGICQSIKDDFRDFPPDYLTEAGPTSAMRSDRARIVTIYRRLRAALGCGG